MSKSLVAVVFAFASSPVFAQGTLGGEFEESYGNDWAGLTVHAKATYEYYEDLARAEALMEANVRLLRQSIEAVHFNFLSEARPTRGENFFRLRIGGQTLIDRRIDERDLSFNEYWSYRLLPNNRPFQRQLRFGPITVRLFADVIGEAAAVGQLGWDPGAGVRTQGQMEAYGIGRASATLSAGWIYAQFAADLRFFYHILHGGGVASYVGANAAVKYYFIPMRLAFGVRVWVEIDFGLGTVVIPITAIFTNTRVGYYERELAFGQIGIPLDFLSASAESTSPGLAADDALEPTEDVETWEESYRELVEDDGEGAPE
jgi:hypothetical protein